MTVAAALHDPAEVGRVLGTLLPTLDAVGVGVVGSVPEADPVSPFGIVVMTGGTERLILRAWARRQEP